MLHQHGGRVRGSSSSLPDTPPPPQISDGLSPAMVDGRKNQALSLSTSPRFWPGARPRETAGEGRGSYTGDYSAKADGVTWGKKRERRRREKRSGVASQEGLLRGRRRELKTFMLSSRLTSLNVSTEKTREREERGERPPTASVVLRPNRIRGSFSPCRQRIALLENVNRMTIQNKWAPVPALHLHVNDIGIERRKQRRLIPLER